METLAMPFNDAGADAQSSIYAMISTINVRMGQIETTTNSRLDRIDQRLDRIIEVQNQAVQHAQPAQPAQPAILLSNSQFAMVVALGIVTVVVLWMVIYYGGTRG